MAGEGFREGSRWIHQRPTGDEIAEWFKENVSLHPGLEHEKYVAGIVVIEQIEKIRTTRDGEIVEDKRLTFTPYTTVSARLVYFRDLMDQRGWRWEIEPDPKTPRTENLPAGFFRYTVEDDAGKPVRFVGCSMIVRAYEQDVRSGYQGRPVLTPNAGSKVVKTIGYSGRPDENALMRAQTGAIGRALGFAGMLVLPGTGIATAEDVREALGGEAAPSPAAAAVPDLVQPQTEVSGSRRDPRELAFELLSELQRDYPDQHQEWVAWVEETKTDLSQIEGTKLRGIVRRLEKLVQKGAAAAGPGKPNENA